MRRVWIMASVLLSGLWLNAGVEAGSAEADAVQRRLNALQAACPANVHQRLTQEVQAWIDRCQAVPNPEACEQVLLRELEAGPSPDDRQRRVQDLRAGLQHCQRAPHPATCERDLVASALATGSAPGACQGLLDRLVTRRQAIWR